MPEVDIRFEARIVHLILSGKTEEALERLSECYNVEVPKIKIGMPKGHVKNRGCYVAGKKTIYFSHRDALYNPHVVLHEFYHHLRTRDRKHRGTEKLADAFAKGYIEAYKELAGSNNDK